tara:strand:- start:17543 stop:18631 length:1089 start_codon:yes stop_codon:yes gene_type:complete
VKKLKISIGSKLIDGPWGGGNLFVSNLVKYLEEKDVELFSDLSDNQLDIILLTEPRFNSPTSTISTNEAKYYKKYINPGVKIIHRINECDERKNTNTVNQKILKANKIADHTVFVSSWLMKIYVDLGKSKQNSSVIYSGSNTSIFNSENNNEWNGKEKIKLVTHHWGNDWNKGFSIYKFIDDKLSQPDFDEKYEFTYIGNLPKDFSFKNVNFITPLSGRNLADKLKENHIYLTASINEPSGNHHIEGALCGLPVLYLESGGTPEYSNGFGVSFYEDNFIEKLEEIVENYDYYKQNMINYPFKSEVMCSEYYSLFESFPKYSFETKGVKFNPFKYNLINKLINSLKIIYMKLVFYYEKIKRIT